jgi:cobalt-zinc-cadmium efflux system outer membrane protein
MNLRSAVTLRLFMLGACLWGGPIHAQDNNPAPDIVDLAEVLRIVRDISPRLAIERQNISGAEANRITAGAYPNPAVNYGRFRPNGGQATLFDGSRQEQATVDVPLLIAGQRSARVEKAEREIEAARARVAVGASSLAAEAGAAFISLLASQEKAALLTQANAELGRLRDIVAGRAELGVASRYDVTRLDVELGSFRAKLEDAKADIADRAGNLAVLLGLPQLRPRASGTLAPLTFGADSLSAPRNRTALSPVVAAATGDERVAQSSVEVAQRERWPVPTVSVGRSWTSHPYGAANFLGLSVEIPIFDTRRGPVAKAESEAMAARLRRELAEAEVAANLERYANIIAARQAALQRFDKESSSRLPALKEMAEQAYRLGRSSIFELLDSTRSRHELQQSRIDLIASLIEAQLRFLATSGSLNQTIGGTGEPARQ